MAQKKSTANWPNPIPKRAPMRHCDDRQPFTQQSTQNKRTRRRIAGGGFRPSGPLLNPPLRLKQQAVP